MREEPTAQECIDAVSEINEEIFNADEDHGSWLLYMTEGDIQSIAYADLEVYRSDGFCHSEEEFDSETIKDVVRRKIFENILEPLGKWYALTEKKEDEVLHKYEDNTLTYVYSGFGLYAPKVVTLAQERPNIKWGEKTNTFSKPTPGKIKDIDEVAF